MEIEIISTGNEIMFGTICDTNSAYIAKSLSDNGLAPSRQNCVSDDLNKLIALLEEVSKRSDIAISTGGLGPTKDDLTALAVSKLSNKKLKANEAAKKNLENYFAKKKIENKKLFEANKKQIFLPENSEIIENSIGTAVGFFIKHNRCLFFFLPGVPSEMQNMMQNHVIPLIKEKFNPDKAKLCATISTFGIGEAKLAKKIEEIKEDSQAIQVGYRASFPYVHINLYAKHEKDIKKTQENILKTLGNQIFSTQNLSLEEELFNLLLKRKKTIAMAESCTGGLIANLLTNISGSSKVFLSSAVTYSNDAKMKILGVKKEIIEKYGAVSIQCAKQMSEGIRKISKADFGLAISGIAGPTGATKDKKIGTFCVAISSNDFQCEEEFCINFENRIKNKKIFAYKALDLLRLSLLEKIK